MARRCLAAVMFLVTLALAAAGCSDGDPPKSGPDPATPSGTPVPSHSLLAKMPEGGTLRVIVTLLWPDGQTPPPSGDERRRAVAQAQDELIQALKPYRGAKVTTRYRLYPLLAMAVDRPALTFLLTSPMVKSVNENAVHKPQQASTLRLIIREVSAAPSIGASARPGP